MSTSTTPSKQDLYDNAASRIRYEAYARLQATALAFGEALPIPEIVAIGGQSDGKSSLMEAFLGFRFNVCSSEMGTRRPLIVQMVHDPSALEPRCQLQEEEGDAYGDVLPQGSIADAIRERTEVHLRRLGRPVSSQAIMMRVSYAFCPDLTIIDTPGFILKARAGEAESTPDDILTMVKQQCAPPHRLILFLQQSSVEWCSSLWTNVIQEVDPTFSRTVMVASKFDNRLKEISERWELEKYLSASGYLPPSVKPFFVALPKDRSHATSAEWRRSIQEVDAGIKTHLRTAINGGFDEERFGPRVGFGNLRRFLEEELAARYRDAAPATLALLQDRCGAVAVDLTTAEQRLHQAGDVAALRRAAVTHVLSMAGRIEAVLRGFGGADPKRFGMTTEEERAAAGAPAWPGAAGDVRPPNASLRLFGGAAFERCLQEFQRAALALDFPAIPRDRVANMLLAQRARGDAVGAAARAAEELACSAAREALAPLLELACARLAAVVRRAYDVASELETADAAAAGVGGAGPVDALRPYVAFHAAVRSAFQAFSQALEGHARELLRHHLQTATGHFTASVLLDGCGSDRSGVGAMADWEDVEEGDEHTDEEQEGAGQQGPLLGGMPGGEENQPPADLPETVRHARPAFVSTQMTIPETPSPDVASATKAAAAHMPLGRRVHQLNAGRNVDADSPAKGRVSKAARLASAGHGGYSEVVARAERLFGRIKDCVAVQAAPATIKAAFLEPLQGDLSTELCVQITGRTDADFMGMFSTPGALAGLEEERDRLARRRSGLVRMTEEFGELARAL